MSFLTKTIKDALAKVNAMPVWRKTPAGVLRVESYREFRSHLVTVLVGCAAISDYSTGAYIAKEMGITQKELEVRLEELEAASGNPC